MPKIEEKIGLGYIEDALQVNKDTLVFKDSTTGEVLDKAAVVAKLADGEGDSLPKAIHVEIEATHSGITKNMTEYCSDKMEKSAHTWTSPYNKPVLKEHDPDGPTLGRVMSYEFKKSELNPEKDTIKLKLEITDKESIRRHMDGTALTYSIGGRAKEVFCNICGIDILNSDDWCGHWKGRNYKVKQGDKEETKQCIWQIGLIDYLEVSEVNIPADEWAQRLSVKAKEEDSLEGETEQDSAGADQQNEAGAANIADGLDLANKILGDDAGGEQSQEPETPPAGDTADSTPPPSGDTPPNTEPPAGKTADEYENELKTLRDELTAVKGELQTTKDELATAKTDLAKAQDDLTKANDKVAEVQNSSQQTFKTSVEVAKTLKRVYAESIADAKVRMGDLTEDKKEEEVNSLVVKSAKELSDTLGGLKVAEKARQSVPRVTTGNVGDGGALGVHQDRVDLDDAKKQTKESKPLTANDAIDAIVNAKSN